MQPPSPPKKKELGGLYFSTNVILSQAGCWVAAALYISYYFGTATRTNDDGTTTVYSLKIDVAAIYSVLGALLGTWLLSAFLFFFKIKPAYWSTFYSTRTGCQQAMSYFLDYDDDATKSIVFGNHPVLWKKIEHEVKEWTLANWSQWEVEKPEWFSKHFKEIVPDRFIPKTALERLHKEAGGERRRSSAFAGSVALPSTRQEGESGAEAGEGN